VTHSWDDVSDKRVLSHIVKGQRAIIVHAGGEQGFVKCSSDV
jgi:hypothetical protein